MRRALISLSLLHGATLLSLAWLYAQGDATLTPNQSSYGSVMLGLAGALMLIGAGVSPKTPALATIPFGLAGLLTLLVRTSGHDYLFAYGGWALALGVAAIIVARSARQQAHEPEPVPPPSAPEPEPEAAPAEPPVPEATSLATDLVRQIPRHRARKQGVAAEPDRPGSNRPRRDAPRVSPVTRPQPALTKGAAGSG